LEINGDKVVDAFQIHPSKLVGDILKYIMANFPNAEMVTEEIKDLVQKEFDFKINKSAADLEI